MSEDRNLIKIASFFQGAPYLYIIFETFLYVLFDFTVFQSVLFILLPLKSIFLFADGNLMYSKVLGLSLIIIASIGTKPKKSINVKNFEHIALPLLIGAGLFFGAIFFYTHETEYKVDHLSNFEIFYILSTVVGAILLHVGFDNISKRIHIGFMKDPFNYDNESFAQSRKPSTNAFSLNLPMEYYDKKKIQKGWFNLTNPFRGTMVIGTPESGKTYSIIDPFIKNFIAKEFTALVYDYKYPKMTTMCYYHHLMAKKQNKDYRHQFHVVNLSDVRFSRRVNPMDPKYIKGLPQCIETAESLVLSLQQTSQSTGSDQFFKQSAINFLSAIFFFLSKYENGKYSSLPHAISLINRPYEDIFDLLFQRVEIQALLSPFQSAHEKGAYSQLEGQIGTLKINIARLATPESYWVFSKEDFDLRISTKEHEALLVIANNPDTENINSATNALLLNRISKLINTPNNTPCGVIIDELPSIYFHKIQNLISTARENKVAVLLGLQELPQLVERYGVPISNTITSVVGNIISGAARKKETLAWLEQLFGKVKQIQKGLNISKTQTTTSINERMDFLIPSSKIASQNTGEVVAKLAFGISNSSDNQENLTTYNCKILIDDKMIKKEKANYVPLPQYYDFGDEQTVIAKLLDNYISIDADIDVIIQNEKKARLVNYG